MLFANKDLYKQKHYNELLYKLKGSMMRGYCMSRTNLGYMTLLAS